MKSKMKSTFAIIAVALMVMVAIVPMVGVFTGSSDAVVPDQDPEFEGTITISGMVYKLNGTPVVTGDDGYSVMVTWGKDSTYYDMADIEDGAYQFVIDENKITNVKVFVVEPDVILETYVPVAEFGSKSLGILEKGDSATANFRSGTHYINDIEVCLADENTLYDLYSDDAIMTVSYTLYKAAAATTKDVIVSGNAIVYNVGTQQAPKSGISVGYEGSYDDVFILITGVSAIVGLEVYSTDKLYNKSTVQILGGEEPADEVILDQITIPFSVENKDIPSATVSITKAYYKDGDDYVVYENTKGKFAAYPVTTDIIAGDADIDFFCDAVYDADGALITIDKYDSSITYYYKAKDSKDNVVDTFTSIKTNQGAFPAYEPNGYYGTVMMGLVAAYDGQAMTMSMYYTYGEDKHKTVTLKPYIKDGCYFAASSEPSDADDNTEYFLEVAISGFTIAGVDDDGRIEVESYDGNVDIAVDDEGFVLVSGSVSLADEDDTAPVLPVSLTISGVTAAFGYPVNGKDSNKTVTVTTELTQIDDEYYQIYALYIAQFDEITFAPASTEKFTLVDEKKTILVDDVEIDLVIAPKTMYFMFTDGDELPITVTPTILIEEDEVAGEIIRGDVTAANVDPSIVAYTTPGFYKLDVYSSFLDITAMNVSFDAEGYNFTYTGINYTKYAPGTDTGYMAVKSLDTTYEVLLYKADGSVAILDENASPFDFAVYGVYESDSGSKVFNGPIDFVVAPEVDVNGLIKVKVPSTYVNPVLPKTNDLLSVALAVILVPSDEAVEAGFILEDYYFLAVDSNNRMTKTAGTDDVSSKIVKRDGVTGIGQINVDLYENYGEQTQVKLGSAVSATDGSFRIITYKAIPLDGISFVFADPKENYVFADSYDVYDTDGEVKEKHKSVADKYSVSIKDADESAILPIDGYKFKVADYTITAEDFALTGPIGLDVGMVISPVYTDNNDNTVRTFAPYTVTAADVANGQLNLITLWSTYVVKITDSLGAKIKTGEVDKAYMAPYKNGVISGEPEEMDVLKATDGTFYAIMPALSDGQEYRAYVTNKMSEPEDPEEDPEFNGNYLFDETETVAFTQFVATIPSLYTKLFFAIQDAAGESLGITAITTVGAAVTDYDGIYDVARPITKIEQSNQASFYGDATATYVPSAAWTVTGGYSIATSAKISAGVLKTTEQKVIFTIKDKLSNPIIFGQDGATLTAYKAEGGVGQNWADIKTDANGTFFKVFEKKATYTYGLVDNAQNAVYTFALTKDTNFVANESILTPQVVSANGVDLTTEIDLSGEDDGVYAYAADGTAIGTTVGKKFIVDTEKVAYYNLVQSNDLYTFDNSLLPLFVANESIVTGSLPFSGDAEQRLEMSLCLDGDVVDMYTLEDEELTTLNEGYSYKLILDLSNYVVGVGAIAFDSIVANYYENNVLVATSSVDPFSTINNIYTPEQQAAAVYKVANKTIGVAAGHTVAYVINGNLLVLSADNVFFVSDEGTYTDGQYKYVFAGWYVDGVKVSANADYAMNIESDVVAAAQYDITYEKISDVNKDVEKEYVNIVEKVEVPVEKTVGIDTNVLIIGICAVIVALIAVVYAVIKKE